MKLFIWKAAVFYYTALDIKAVWATHRHNLVFHHTCIEYFNDFGNNSFCILYFFLILFWHQKMIYCWYVLLHHLQLSSVPLHGTYMVFLLCLIINSILHN